MVEETKREVYNRVASIENRVESKLSNLIFRFGDPILLGLFVCLYVRHKVRVSVFCNRKMRRFWK